MFPGSISGSQNMGTPDPCNGSYEKWSDGICSF